MRGFLDGHISLSTDEAVSHHECQFGKWLKVLEGRHGRLSGTLSQVAQPHEKLHTAVKHIIQLKHAGHNSEAERTFSRLDELSTAILVLLDDARREAIA